MSLIELKCSNCGGTIQVDDEKEKMYCPFCGVGFIVRDTINNYNINIYNGEENIDALLDEAEKCFAININDGIEKYESIREKYPTDYRAFKRLFEIDIKYSPGKALRDVLFKYDALDIVEEGKYSVRSHYYDQAWSESIGQYVDSLDFENDTIRAIVLGCFQMGIIKEYRNKLVNALIGQFNSGNYNGIDNLLGCVRGQTSEYLRLCKNEPLLDESFCETQQAAFTFFTSFDEDEACFELYERLDPHGIGALVKRGTYNASILNRYPAVLSALCRGNIPQTGVMIFALGKTAVFQVRAGVMRRAYEGIEAGPFVTGNILKRAGLCPYCGGQFKGMFNKTCSKCGKPKDY